MRSRPAGPPYKVGTIANFMLDRARTDRRRLTHLKLQRLVYMAYGWATVFLKEPLFEEPIEAWPFGPVVPHLWHEFKAYRNKPIKGRSFDYNPDTNTVIPLSVPNSDKATRDILEMTWQNYGHVKASALTRRTHAPGTPWQKTSPHEVIRPEDIAQQFLGLYNQFHVPQRAS